MCTLSIPHSIAHMAAVVVVLVVVEVMLWKRKVNVFTLHTLQS